MNIAIVNCFDTYEHRVDLLYAYFKANKNNARVYTSDFRHIEKKQRTQKKKDFIYIHSLGYKKNISLQRMISHHKTARDVFSRIETQKVDLLWVLVPPNSFVKEAAMYKMRHKNVKLIFDIIDMWPETMPLTKFEKVPLVAMWRELRDKYLRYADHIVTECDLYQEKLVNIVDSRKMTTIYLARQIKPFTGSPNPPDDKIALCYLGSINNIIDIPAISDIIAKAKKIKPVVLHIIGDGEKRHELIERAKNIGAEVIYHGKIYDSAEKQRIFDICHYGLNIMKESVFVGLTMKSMDYFEAGLPIINNIHGDTWNIVNDYNIGINYGQVSSFSDYDYSMRTNARGYFEENMSINSFNNNIEMIMG